MIKIYTLMSFGLLPIRIIAGIGFIMNGLPKLVNITGTEAEFASSMGLPAALALPVGLLEVIGGIALIIGVLTRIASILFIILMIGAIITVQLSKGFLGGCQTGGIIFPINYTVWGKVINNGTLPSGHVTVTLNITSPNGALLFKTDTPVFPHTLLPRQEGSFTFKFTSHDLRGYTGNDWTYYVSVSKQ